MSGQQDLTSQLTIEQLKEIQAEFEELKSTDDPTVDIEALKRAEEDLYYELIRRDLGMRPKPHRKHGSNYTPPKKRHRK